MPQRSKPWDGFACEQGLVLDVGIWVKLPFDIQLKLLVHLPLPALVRFQLVCKAWYKAIRNIKQVTVHGDCYIARVVGDETALRVYSSLHEGRLDLNYPRWIKCLTCTSNGLLCLHNGFNTLVYHPFTRKTITIPDPPIKAWASFCGMQSGEEAGDFAIVRVVGYGPERMLLVYKSGRGTWEATPLQLPADEEFSVCMAGVHSFHGKIDGSTLYFLAVNLRTPEMSVRSVEVLGCNVTGIGRKLFSWASLPPCYSVYAPVLDRTPPYARRFTGNIAIVAGDVFMGCMRLVQPKKYTVALLVYDKQGKNWKLVSEMPLGKGFVPWRPHNDNYVELCTQGDTLIVCNFFSEFACLYNTSTKVWSMLDRGQRLTEVCDLKLSLRS